MEDSPEREEHDGVSPWLALVIGLVLGVLLWSGFLVLLADWLSL